MEPTDQLAKILPTLTQTVERIQVMQMNDPTPCDHFTVHGVLNHMIVLGGTFSYVFRGEEPPELTAPAVYGWVPLAEFREVMDDLLESVNSPGAMERTVNAPIGEMPGSTFARFVAFDGLVHGWDLATATGQPYDPPDDVVAAVDEFARSAIGPEMRDGDTFKDPAPEPAGASRLERLVAFSGRAI